MSTVKYSVKASGETATKLTVKARQFEVIIDEPPALGGTDAGPNPVEYVLSALSGCMYIVGFVIAGEMGFKLNSLKIETEGELNPDKFMGKDVDTRAGFESISVTLIPDADADEATLAKWLEIIKTRCPVSDNLANPTPVKISL